MEDKQISILMKYVHGEISFAEWIEGGSGAGDTEQDDNSMQVDRDGEEEEIQAQTTCEISEISAATSEGNNESPGK